MFSKEESRKLREEFWISFGKSYPRKWILYKTKIKGLSFKFHFDVKKAMVSLDIEGDLNKRIELWEKIVSLKSILISDYLPDAHFEDYHLLDNHKEISRVYLIKDKVSIHNKNTWRETMEFLNKNMAAFEAFYTEYKDIIQP
ncbi:DUF4268 domain-containing protein [Maribacter sp. MMG018]|uniref:DUF4268 domain-containing protein n=1 Tax=Maribacter sp. MMG018 TaxID=2822688 RepID=UPI001B394B32|nr:DUF4268 domain-containing protein [Maribacter sp. MMG018]MBQ4915774.1 DUF4268 domain-containing protein [Maribacter sp. MMG018]